LISFLNSILNLTGKNAIKEVEFEEKHLDVSLIASEKLSIFYCISGLIYKIKYFFSIFK